MLYSMTLSHSIKTTDLVDNTAAAFAKGSTMHGAEKPALGNPG